MLFVCKHVLDELENKVKVNEITKTTLFLSIE